MLGQNGAEQAVAAQIYTAAGATPQTVASGTPEELDIASNGLSNQCVADAANNRITTTHAGLYHVDMQMSFSAEFANDTWTFQLRQNGVAVTKAACQRFMSNADVGSVGFVATVQAAAGDNFTIYADHSRAPAGTDADITINELQLVMHRLDRTG